MLSCHTHNRRNSLHYCINWLHIKAFGTFQISNKITDSYTCTSTNPEGRVWAASKTLLEMKEKLVAEGLGGSFSEDLIRSVDVGDEGDHADNERTNEVSILLSARDQEKLLAIEDALEKIGEGTYGMCEEYNGPRNLDRVICYTWERKRGGPSGEFEEAASAVV